jgi:hypothetical protein
MKYDLEKLRSKVNAMAADAAILEPSASGVTGTQP